MTSHSFRKSVATLIDDEGLSARIGADHLGHARVSETQDTYMAGGRSHKVVAELLDKAIRGIPHSGPSEPIHPNETPAPRQRLADWSRKRGRRPYYRMQPSARTHKQLNPLSSKHLSNV